MDISYWRFLQNVPAGEQDRIQNALKGVGNLAERRVAEYVVEAIGWLIY
jgi:hypothetical protein